MCTLYERIQELCRRKGVSGSKMCLDLGLSKSTLSDIKNGRKKGISTSTAQKFAAYLDVSVGYLLGEEDEKKDQTTNGDLVKEKSPSESTLTEGEELMLKLFRQIPEDRQSAALELLKAALKMQ